MLAAPVESAEAPSSDEAQAFLVLANSLTQGSLRAAREADWAATTDVTPYNEGRLVGASSAYAALLGDKELVATARRLLEGRDLLAPLQIRQLEAVLDNASAYPATIPDVVAARVRASARASAVQDGFEYCLEPRQPDGGCAHPKTTGDIDDILRDSVDLDERHTAWQASKEVGRPLKPLLVELRDLRNQVAREMGYTSYLAMQVSDYDMSVDEMMALNASFVRDLAPLNDALKTWMANRSAERYGVAPPTGLIPAHWAPHRHAQRWSGLVAAFDLDQHLRDRSPEWIVRTAESFYVSLGLAPLPASFWERSDLYPVGPEGGRQKSGHAWAYHMDLDQDVRSVMSVQSDTRWFLNAHHELGHAYYYLAYSRPEVPPLLRDGANRAFHEAIGELAGLAASQVPYLKSVGVIAGDLTIDPTAHLLADALESTVVYMPFAAGVMPSFEHALYEEELPPDQWQARWWDLVESHQGVTAPSDRRSDPGLCDACTKSHIIDDPASYYDYAIAQVLKFQLHEHICADLLGQSPRSCDYSGHPEVGAFLTSIMERGATQDWREVLRDATGEDLSTRAMVDYYAPLLRWLTRENARAARRRSGR